MEEETAARRRVRPALVNRLVREFMSELVIGCSLLLSVLLAALFLPGREGAQADRSRLDLMAQLEAQVNNSTGDALGDLAYIPKHYVVPEDTRAPAPDEALFGSTKDPGEIMALIEQSGELLQGQEAAFDPNADFYSKGEIRYYRDETILAIVWQEIIDGRCCTCAEVKIADGSQLRRKLSGDAYSSGIGMYASDMAREAGAVVAINGDFYAFRTVGLNVYQRQVRRFENAGLDTCFFTADGDMLFAYAGELADAEEAQRFVDDNDVLFAVTFGPILVDNGELRAVSPNYPLGQVTTPYSRSGIGMLGPLHYFLMTVNFAPEYGTVATVAEFAQYMYDKGCQKAYTLDGGQTAVLILDGQVINHVDYGYERTMSDIIYFTTALPEEEALR